MMTLLIYNPKKLKKTLMSIELQENVDSILNTIEDEEIHYVYNLENYTEFLIDLVNNWISVINLVLIDSKLFLLISLLSVTVSCSKKNENKYFVIKKRTLEYYSKYCQIENDKQKLLSLNQINNFNLSVMVSNHFMELVKNKKWNEIITYRIEEDGGKIPVTCGEIWKLIVRGAHTYGDPCLLFDDTINADNKLIDLGRIKTTNPCGEQPLRNYESCNLGSINISKYVVNDKFDLGYTLYRNISSFNARNIVSTQEQLEFNKMLKQLLKNTKIKLTVRINLLSE